jgi:raffinose/stachyose/melibiose transport system substrate-binding protein
MHRRGRGPTSRLFVAACSAVAMVLSACAGDDSSSAPEQSAVEGSAVAAEPFDPAAAGDVTIDVWTAEFGNRLELVQGRIDEFMAEYPNVTVDLTVRDFGAYPAQLKLALTSDDAPDVAIGNIGWSLDGPLIKAGLLRELTPWAGLYGWDTRYSEVAQKQLRFSTDGTSFGNGPLFGVPYAADVIGWFYNSKKLAELGLEPPATFAELEAALQAAKDAGEVPMMLGNKDQWPGLHVFYTINNNLSSTDEVTGIVFGEEGVAWTDPSFVESAEKLADWAAKGYFVEGFNGLAPADANVKFAEGEGLFLPAGSWNVAELSEGMPDGVGFFLTPPNEAGEPRRATGSFGYGWHISSASDQPDLAAALIDWLTNEDSARAFFAAGDIAPLNIEGDAPESSTQVRTDVFAAWNEVLATDSLMLYLDFSDPNGGEVMYPTMQSILSGEKDPAAGLADIEAARQQFLATLK